MEGLYISAAGIASAIRRSAIAASNVANVSTTGYRAAHVTSAEVAGGGVRIGGVSRDDAQGPVEFTGSPMDVASSGYFRVRLPGGAVAYTRDGHFGLNASGEVVTESGALLDPPVAVPPGATSVAVTRSGTVLAVLPGQVGAQVIGQLEVFQFPNPDGLMSAGGNLYQQTAASGEPGRIAAAEYLPGMLGGSNVNLAVEQTETILDLRAVEANMDVFRAQDEIIGELLDITG